MNKEIWKDIIGYEGLYQVSNLGRIKSLPKFHKTNTTGYMQEEKNIETSCWYKNLYVCGFI